MILTCPECATSYFVDPASIPPAGRMVKCTNCGARWRAEPGGADAEPDPEVMPSPPPGQPLATDVYDDLEVVAPDTEAGRKPASSGKAKPPQPDKPKARVGMMVGIAAALVVILGGLGGAVLFRTQVTGMVPGAAAVFAAVGLPVNEMGLVLEGVASKPTFQAGRPVLSISGAVRNTKEVAAAVPPIRFVLVDPEGVEVASLTAEASGENLPGGGVRYFTVALPDPPAGASELVAAFDLSGGPPDHE